MQELIRSQVKPEIQVFANPEALTQAAATKFVQQAHQAIQARGRFTIALSGGSTPKSLYALLATQPWRNQIPWNQVHLLWGDERHVPPSDASSNFRMTQERLLFQGEHPNFERRPEKVRFLREFSSRRIARLCGCPHNCENNRS